MAKAEKNIAPKEQAKTDPITPEVLPPQASSPSSAFTMDGTSHVEISGMQNIYYSKEIIEETRAAFSIDRLKSKISDDNTEFLVEGERQIQRLWHGIEALTVHNTMFVVLFLISIGEILNEVSEQLSHSEFVKWRRRLFHPKQERYLQQAKQLATMGDFAKKYAAMGKKRLLILDRLRKDEDKETYEGLFENHPMPEEVENGLLDDEQIKDNPFPDSTEDFEGELLKEHVDALITFHRLKKAGIGFVTFDQAYLAAAFKKNPLPVKMADKIANWLEQKGTTIPTKKRWFNILILNKMVFPETSSRQSRPRGSLNYMLGNFISYCENCDFNDPDWKTTQGELIDDDIVRQSNFYLKKIARALDVRLTQNRSR